jgi:hypothetical protein
MIVHLCGQMDMRLPVVWEILALNVLLYHIIIIITCK